MKRGGGHGLLVAYHPAAIAQPVAQMPAIPTATLKVSPGGVATAAARRAMSFAAICAMVCTHSTLGMLRDRSKGFKGNRGNAGGDTQSCIHQPRL